MITLKEIQELKCATKILVTLHTFSFLQFQFVKDLENAERPSANIRILKNL